MDEIITMNQNHHTLDEDPSRILVENRTPWTQAFFSNGGFRENIFSEKLVMIWGLGNQEINKNRLVNGLNNT